MRWRTAHKRKAKKLRAIRTSPLSVVGIDRLLKAIADFYTESDYIRQKIFPVISAYPRSMTRNWFEKDWK